MRQFFTSRLMAFRYAFSGLSYLMRTQPNSRIHLAATVLVVLLAAYVKITVGEWIFLILTIGLVWIAEMINTAIETVLDLVSPQQNPLAKYAKDVSAAAVLVSAVVSVLVGLLVLGQPLWARISQLFGGY